MNTSGIIEDIKSKGETIINEMYDYSYPGDEPKLDDLIKTSEVLPEAIYSLFRKFYFYPYGVICEYKGVKSVILYHGIDTKCITKTIIPLSEVLIFCEKLPALIKEENTLAEERAIFEKNFSKNFPKKPENSVPYDTKKELAQFRKNVGYYFDRINHLLTQNVIAKIGDNSPIAWKNLGKRILTSELYSLLQVTETLRYIDTSSMYRKENKWQH